jgi:GT2 family glycosyltransferase
MDSAELISVVITTYNRSDALLAVLGGLLVQTDRHFEVIVADDGSREAHQQVIFDSLAARSLNVAHVWHPDVGFTASRIRNRGVAASRGKYIIFLDGDCVPETDFIARHRSLAEPGYFINGSRVLLSEALTGRVVAGLEQVSGRPWSYWVKQRLLGHASKLGGLLRLSDSHSRIERKFSWKGIRSCNLAVWRSDFERVDGFDESFIGWGHEDADFVLRLHHSGIMRKNGYCSTEVFHLWHKEAARAQESRNAQVVAQRAKTNITQPDSGFSQPRLNDDVVVRRLG